MTARFLAVLFAALAFLTAPALADTASDAKALVDRVHQASFDVAHEGTPVPDLLRDAFDGPFIAQAALGKYWTSARPADRAQFVDALVDAVVKTLVRRLGRHRDQDFQIVSTKTITGGDVIVRSRLSPPGQDALTIDWRVHRCKAALCIADLIVGGASMTLQRRDDLAARLKANGGSLPKLIADLRKNPIRL
jgi:phospholipid transport system substrate-binding protein